MRRIEAMGYGIVGAVLVAIAGPLFVWAAQTYVLPTTSTGQKTELLTNAPNRDEALRSHFAGLSPPTSPAPTEGQGWWDSQANQMYFYTGTQWNPVATWYSANLFSLPQRITTAADPYWEVMDSTNSVINRLQSTDTEGRVGTSSNHPMCVQTNANCRVTIDASGNAIFTAGLSTTKSCVSGYTRLGLLCMKTDGTYTLIRGVFGANDSSYVTTALTAGFKAAYVLAEAEGAQNSSAETASVQACVLPGDSATTFCTTSVSRAVVTVNLANEESWDSASYLIRLDSAAQLKTRCSVPTGSLASACNWYLMGYLD